jgi:hypothetical protein
LVAEFFHTDPGRTLKTTPPTVFLLRYPT